MLKHCAAIALIAATMAVSSSVMAQSANDKVLVIFGKDPCPAGTICVRAPEAERFRIPKQFRQDATIKPENQSWAARAGAAMEAGAKSGPGSCTPSGPGGWTGCWQQQMRAARAEAAQQKAAQPDLDP